VGAGSRDASRFTSIPGATQIIGLLLGQSRDWNASLENIAKNIPRVGQRKKSLENLSRSAGR